MRSVTYTTTRGKERTITAARYYHPNRWGSGASFHDGSRKHLITEANTLKVWDRRIGTWRKIGTVKYIAG